MKWIPLINIYILTGCNIMLLSQEHTNEQWRRLEATVIHAQPTIETQPITSEIMAGIPCNTKRRCTVATVASNNGVTCRTNS